MKTTVVIPVFNERETLEPLVAGIAACLPEQEYTILFVDDGSTDGSYETACALHERTPAVEVIRLRRNFGKSAALAAGFAKADGGVVITMDGDLQDDPKEIPKFLEKLNEGYDVVCGWKQVRHDPWHKTIPSRIYNKFVSRAFRLELHDVNCGYKAFRTDVIKRIRVYGDLHRLIPVLAANLGYRIAEIPVEHHPRRHGVSKYGLERFARGAADVLALMFVCRYGHRPGHFFTTLGLACIGGGALVSFLACLAGLSWKAAIAVAALGLAGVGLMSLGVLAELWLYHGHADDPGMFVKEEERKL